MKKKYKFALVGVGSVGKSHAAIINSLPDAELVSVIDKNGDAGRKFAQQYNSRYYDSIQEAILKEDIDIASISTPSSSHCAIAMEFVNAGKHVIVEKPIDISLEAIDRLNEAARSKGVKVCTIFQHRFDDGIVKAKKAINEGRLGRVYFGACHTKWYRDQDYYGNSGWRGTWAFDGGGALMNQSIHYIDLLQYLVGDVCEVYGSCGTFAHEKIEVEDLGIATVKFSNGALGIIEGTTAAYPGLYTKLDIYGEKGSLCIQNDELIMYNVMGMTPEEEKHMVSKNEPEAVYGPDAAHRRQYVDMLEAVENNREPKVNGVEGKKSVEIILSIYKSWKSNTPVTL